VQQLWFATQRRPWSTLALVAADEPIAVGGLALALATVGRLTNTGEVDLLNSHGASLPEATAHLNALRLAQGRGARVVVATDPVVTHPGALPLILAADVVVLVLSLLHSRGEAAERALELIGRERVLGCALVSPEVAT
jgi:hypothetical protein